MLLDADERSRLLQADMRAADLGAAPGGWTWVLTRHGLNVTAIDNGPLRAQLLDSGRVEHLRTDGGEEELVERVVMRWRSQG